MFKVFKYEQKSFYDSSLYLSTLKTNNTNLDSDKNRKVFIVSSSNKKFLNQKKFKTTFKYSNKNFI